MTPQDINRFWIDEVGPAGWYAGTDALDEDIRQRFQPLWEDAADVTCNWHGSPVDLLAALILTDQFPRNMFRSDARGFATDPLARALAQVGIDKGFDAETPEPQKQFFYMPFMHSEALRDQDRSVQLFAERMPGDNLRHAHLHRAVIVRFGRFPWRNPLLDRHSSPDEIRFLDAGGYGALVSGKLSLDDL